MTAPGDLALDTLADRAGTLRVFRQVFAVLAREVGSMIGEADTLDVDEAILAAFAGAGTDGLTIERVVAACAGHDPREVTRRFEVLRSYGAVTRVAASHHERYHRAAFAPYVMLLFLRRMAEQGGQGELHQLLTITEHGVRNPNATRDDGQAAVRRLVTVFRLMANQLSGLAATSPVEELRENAELLWGNARLLGQARDVHAAVLDRWPDLDRDCARLRNALAGYGDASDAAAARLLAQAGATRALGLLPVETWRTFTRTADVDTLAGVLDGVLFDAPAPWFAPQALAEALASSAAPPPTRTPPPRPASDASAPDTRRTDDAAEAGRFAESRLGPADEVDVVQLLDDAGDWTAGRRVLARLTAAHHHAETAVELVWADDLRIAPDGVVPWASGGRLVRRPRPEDGR